MTDVHRCLDCDEPLVPCTCRPDCLGGQCPVCEPSSKHVDIASHRSFAKRLANITTRPRMTRINLAPSNECCSHLLELFKQEDGPDNKGKKHGVWLHHLKTGGYRWECACGASRDHSVLDAALLAEAHAHFDQAWEPPAIPLGHPVAVWNNRAAGRPSPSKEDLEKLAIDLAHGGVGVSVEVQVVNLCGLCGQIFTFKPDDPHWVTGRGPICPPIAGAKP